MRFLTDALNLIIKCNTILMEQALQALDVKAISCVELYISIFIRKYKCNVDIYVYNFTLFLHTF